MQISEEGKNFSNLTKEERDAFYSLRNDSNIVIKSADKGSAVVVWDREDYLKETDSQLSDNDIYEELPNDPTAELTETIQKCIADISCLEVLDQDTLKFLQPDDPKLGRFYLLPKIQKRFYRVPGRPIISNSGYFTENISAFVDHHLQPLATTVKSYIKDTNDFLRKIKGFQNITEDTILCSIDVVGLYPNIPHDEGLKALEKKLNERQNPKIPTETLVKMADLVLKNNVFLHNGKTYRQKRGTAMGTKKLPHMPLYSWGILKKMLLMGTT